MSLVPPLDLPLGSVADPGFPRGGVPNPKGVPTYDLNSFFFREQRENEEILARGGGGFHVPNAPFPPLDPPLDTLSKP